MIFQMQNIKKQTIIYSIYDTEFNLLYCIIRYLFQIQQINYSKFITISHLNINFNL